MNSFVSSKKGKIIIAAVCLVVIVLLLVLFLVLGIGKGYRTISVSDIFGSVMTENDGKEYEAYKNMRLTDGDILTTDIDSYTRMILDGEKYIKLEEKSKASFEELGTKKNRKTVINLEQGVLTNEITVPLNEEEIYEVNTPNATLSVRGTFFRVVVREDVNGDAYTDVYTYGGTVACRRIMPDGTIVDEEVLVHEGYKACIKMDEIVTIYVEELIEEEEDKVDPINVKDIPDWDLVDIYNAAIHGHKMFLDIDTLWQEIEEREIDIDEYKSAYDSEKIEKYPDYKKRVDKEKSDKTDSERGSDGKLDKNKEKKDNNGSNNKDPKPDYDKSDKDTPDSPQTENDGHYPDVPPKNDDEFVVTTVPDGYEEPDETTVTVSSENGKTDDDDTFDPDDKSDDDDDDVFDPDDESDDDDDDTFDPDDKSDDDDDDVFDPDDESDDDDDDVFDPDDKSGDDDDDSTVTLPPSSDPDIGDLTNTGSTTTFLPVTEHTHSFGEYVSDNNATCTKDGTKTARCRCGAKNTITDAGTATGHTEETERVEPTFTQEGYVKTYCTVCGEVIENEILDKLSAFTLYTEDGSIRITETGYTQGNNEVEYTGDYVISQRDSSAAVECAITVESGANITIDEVNINGNIENNGGIIEINSGKIVADSLCNYENSTIGFNSGSVQLNNEFFNNGTITVDGAVIESVINGIGLDNPGDFTVNSGSLKINDASLCNNGNFTLVNGNVTVKNASGECYLNNGTFTVKGGKLIGNSEMVCLNNTGAFIIDNAEVEFDNNIWNKGEFKIESGSLNVRNVVSDITCLQNEEQLYINGGTIVLEGHTCISNSGNAYINEGNLSLITTEYGISNFSYGKLYINGAEIDISAQSNDGYSTAMGIQNVGANGVIQVTNGNLLISTNGYGIDNHNQFTLNGGRIKIICTVPVDYAINGHVNNNKTFEVNGGSLEFEGNMIFNYQTGALIVNGGSVKISNNPADYITNSAGGAIERVVYDTFPTEAERTFTNSDGTTYVYALTEADKADDGKYYVWKPINLGVAINDTNFPDTVFRNYISTNFDSDTDGMLSVEEIAAVTEINVGGTSVYSLKGVEYFIELIKLNCSSTSVTSLNVSSNLILKELMCSNVGISVLDISNNTALTKLNCSWTGITSLDVSNNTALTYLVCSQTRITSLDVSKNLLLEELQCSCNEISSLDVSNNTTLSTLWCNDSKLSFVDISNNPNISAFYSDGNYYSIPSNATTFDTSTIEGFDPTKVSNVTNADFDPTTGIFTNITGDITYTYDCGQGYSVTFTLTRTG